MTCEKKGALMIDFMKMAGHGNDFIVINDLEGRIDLPWKNLAPKWCARRTGIGADGILVVEQSSRAKFRMRIFNADGSEAEMCGNGARCIAGFAYTEGIAPADMTFETVAGIIKASVDGCDAAIRLTDPRGYRSAFDVELLGERIEVSFINSGVPHAIYFTDDVDNEQVESLGRAVRFNSLFKPEGTNVDFVQATGPRSIRVRTYERGVEAETLACGTGAVASALVSFLEKGLSGPSIDVAMPGGVLTVSFERQGESFCNVWLKGVISYIYRGKIIQEGWRE
ncbi:MAG: diaminopimelate epimerase [Deltaproteobacteria bacterium]|nr:diaminopimelate epimerase [Deltaproteobacteria bacterium]